MSWKGVYQSPCDLVPYWPPSRSNFSSCGASTGMPYYKKQQWKFWERCPYCTLPPRGHIVIVPGTIWASIDKYQTVSEPQTPRILLVTEEKKRNYTLCSLRVSYGCFLDSKNWLTRIWMQFPTPLLHLVLLLPFSG
ncbi:hypothetical protein D5086_030776 [Populus alba]|uniref:Uncharacterized protein n=2 Tax=Populus TaxID=3689 RepID=A0ACC4APJ5_POPAL|nr:hypothetical protein NC653_038316 [Populus alba x Populus x berolinensis]